MHPHNLSLKTLIRAVSEELLAARSDRLSQGTPPLFEVDELILEVSFVISESDSGGGGFDLKVIKADMSKKYDEQSIQKITLKLKSLRGNSSVLTDLGDELPLRPRSDDD